MLSFFRLLGTDPSRVGPLLAGGVVGIALLLLGGCTGGPDGASRIDPQQIRPMEEVAVVSVRTAKPYQNNVDDPSAEDARDVREAVHAIQEMSERRSRRAPPDFQETAEQVRAHLFRSFHSAAPFALVDEATVLTAPAYRNVDPPRGSDSDVQSSLFATPDGYRSLDPIQLRKRGRLPAWIDSLPSEPDGVLFAETEYTLVPDDVKRTSRNAWTSPTETGTRTRTTRADGDTVGVTVEATLRVHVLDRTGATALKVVKTGQSDDGFRFVYGEGWTADQIEDPVRQATRTALGDITAHVRNKLPNGAVARLSGAIQPTVSAD